MDNIAALSDVVASLSALPHRPTARIVFDGTQPPSYYAQAVPTVLATAMK